MSDFIMPRSDSDDDDDDDDSDYDASGDSGEEVSLPILPLSLPVASLLVSNCSPIVLPEQIVNENFLLCRRQGHSHLLSASTKSVSNGCD